MSTQSDGIFRRHGMDKYGSKEGGLGTVGDQ